MAGRELQRIGLLATVGNPEALVDWIGGSGTNATLANELAQITSRAG